MKFSIALFLSGCLSFTFIACNNANNKEIDLLKKELELKNKELELKDKEAAVQNLSTGNTINENTSKNDSFYILNIAATKSENEARKKVRELQEMGYDADYLWIPDYASLSGALFYCVYIGPFYTQYDCELATEEYRRINPTAYGLLVSQENKRVQINGIGKVSVSKAK